MEKRKNIIKKILITLGILCSVILTFTVIYERPTFADSGHSVSHSSSHSSHSSSHSSSSSRRSSSSSSRSSSSRSSSSSGDPFAAMISVIIMIAIIVIWTIIANKKQLHKIVINKNNEDEIENKIKKSIPNFNKQEFLKQGYSIYYDIQMAWMDFKLEDIKDKVTDEIYTMYESQLATLEVKGEQNIMKNIQLKQSCLKDVTNQNGTITIKTNYVIEMYDYIADVNTKKLIRGEDKKKIRILYEMSFRKTLNEDEKITHCPNCGAKVEMNSTGTCEYCGSKLVSENTKWVLTEKKVIEQDYI
jgi:predicted lipid-binding transport protein (Tim44 family)/DNA-directed RNA polymerase subunit RPC12/RpoP